jgi:hypothetical protein
MDYLLVFLDVHDCFPSQMILVYNCLSPTLCTSSMIAFACEWKVVTCSWFGFNAIIVLDTHLFELTFESAILPFSKTINWGCGWRANQVLWNKSWMDVSDLFVASTISNQPVAGSIIVSASKAHRVCFGWLAGILIVNGPTRSTQTMTQESKVRFCYFGWEQPIFLTLLLCHLT